jgi:DNA repair protein RecN (Recombination protein N)
MAAGVLTELHIENLGVIERLELIFGDGLTVVTGETGAGKTMLVEAIELLVGGRADTTVVRHGTDEARVDGRFITAAGDELVLSRVIARNGRSRAYLNGRLATVASLAEATDGLVDLHGQHAHQSLLSTATQRAALDRFGKIDLEPLRAARARLTEIDAELATLGGDERVRAREIDLLRYQLEELDAADVLDADEDVRLDAEETMLGDAVAYREAGEHAVDALADDGGARDRLAAALGTLEGREPYADAVSRLHAVLSEVDDVVAAVRRLAESIDESPERLETIRERRQLLKNLCRKYGDDLAAVMVFRAQTQCRLDELEQFEVRAAALDDARQRALADEEAAASAVGLARRKAAPKLAAAVQAALRELALPHAEIAVQVGDHDDDNPGDHVAFLLAANPGSPLLPLTRVASGGELARTMLALRLTLTGGAAPGLTLVFDEVDAGIGGAAATAVGSALARLGDDTQVLVVTHLAQVAALAATQFVVDKSVHKGTTTVTATAVSGDERVAEVARMLSGRDSDSARRHARELLT